MTMNRLLLALALCACGIGQAWAQNEDGSAALPMFPDPSWGMAPLPSVAEVAVETTEAAPVAQSVDVATEQSPLPAPLPGRLSPEQYAEPESLREYPPLTPSQRPAARPAEPWKMPQPRLFQQLGISAGGWLQQGYTYNAVDPGDGFNGPLATNDRANEYQLNQGWLYLVRPLDTKDGGFDVGGRIDMSYGTDWRFGKNPGLEDEINSEDNFYGLVLPQFYGEVGYNRLSVKAGHFGTRYGYEMVPSAGNFFYSHSYLMSYTEPLLVTGVEADYRLTDQLVVVGGFNRGWMMFEDLNDDLDFLGGFLWTSFDERTSLKFMTTSGAQDLAGEQTRFGYSVVLQHQATKRLRYVLQHNLGFEDDGDYRTGEDAEWYGLSQYLIYTLTPKLGAGARVEWLRDDDGSRVAGVGNWIGSDQGWLGLPGFAGDFYEVSLGLNWRPHPNIAIRPETRWDWYNGTTNLAGQRPFDNGNRDDQFTFATDLIVTF